jgi:hypothetical protein
VKDKKALNVLQHRDTRAAGHRKAQIGKCGDRLSFMNGVLTRLHFSKRMGNWGCWLRVWQAAVMSLLAAFLPRTIGQARIETIRLQEMQEFNRVKNAQAARRVTQG